MRLIALTIALLFGMFAAGPPASSQSDRAPASTADQAEETADERVERWDRVLDRVEAQVKEQDLSLSLLGELDATVDGVLEQVDVERRPLQSEVDRIGALIEALGPRPKEGEAPEAESVAAERRTLDEQLSVPLGQLRKLDVLVEQMKLLSGSIARAQGEVLKAQLLVRTPSLISAETWSKAASEFAALGTRIATSPGRWYRSSEVSGTVGPGYFIAAFIAVLGAGVLGLYFRRWLIRNYGPKRSVEEPSYRMRVLAALAMATANTVIPILVVAVAYGALQGRSLLFGTFQHLVFGIVAAAVWVSVLYGLPRAMLSPIKSQWRLLHMGDLAARLWYRRALTLAVIVAIDGLVTRPFHALEPSLPLQFTYAFIADAAMAAVFLAVVLEKRLWRTPEEEARALAIEAGEPPGPALDDSARRSPWWLAGRVLVGALALSIPITALAGYGVLADHIAQRLLLSAGIFLTALVFHGLARDLVAVFTRDEEKPPGPDEKANPIYVWSVLLLDIGLMLTIVFFLVPLWGGRWDNIAERIGWALSGFKIGGRTFALTDVLFGMAVFVVLIILVRFIRRFLDVRVLQQTQMDVGVRDAIKAGISYVGVVIAGLIAIDTAGIDLTGLAIIAGALSVGIGFGMQSIVNNFVSGLILLVERPIKEGDWIVVGQDQGYVKRIGVRSTQIQTFSNASVIVPNSELIAGRVTNWMYKDRSGRAELPIGVAYGSDTAKVREILLDCVKGDSRVRAWPQANVVFLDFGDSALLFELRFYVRDIDDRLVVMSDLRFAIDAAFREAGITIPFPQRDVHVIEAGGAAVQPEQEAAPRPGKVLPIRSRRRADDAGLEQESEE